MHTGKGTDASSDWTFANTLHDSSRHIEGASIVCYIQNGNTGHLGYYGITSMFDQGM